MRPPYDITPKILQRIRSISEKIGAVQANHLNRPSPQLRKQNRIKTIQSTLQIEGNTLTEDQITALIDQKRVVGPKKEILEVLNAIQVYEAMGSLQYHSEKSFLRAHAVLMDGLIQRAGKYRNTSVGVVHGNHIEHLAPPHENVPYLMRDLFEYLKKEDELILIKSCVFHYEMEFIHPFVDGNGRMGRLWQTVILLKEYPVFEFLPFETLVGQTQGAYYQSLSLSDKSGKSTPFIEYMLSIIDQSLERLLEYNHRIWRDVDRLEYFLLQGHESFSRKDYMNVFKDISSATASRDLKKGLELNWLESFGKINTTRYRKK